MNNSYKNKHTNKQTNKETSNLYHWNKAGTPMEELWDRLKELQGIANP